MRILYLVHRIPYPPDKGDKIRSFRWLSHLAENHEIHLVTLLDDEGDRPHVAALDQYCRSVHVAAMPRLASGLSAARRLLGSDPLSLAWFHQAESQRAVDAILAKEDVDVALCFSSTTAEYLKRHPSLPRVMDMVDVDSSKFASYSERERLLRRRLYAMEGKRLAAYEEDIARDFDATVLCTEPEAAMLRARVPEARIDVIGNGVDLPPSSLIPEDRPEPRLLFIGAMDYLPNVDAVVFGAKEILPRIREVIPEASFHIVGRNPTRDVVELGGLPGVEVHGAVDSLEPHLAKASAALIPLRIARGIQNKVLEAMSWELPVVTTPKILSSLGAESGKHLEVGESADALARAAIKVLGDRGAARAMGEAARRFVADRFEWRSCETAMERLLEECAAAEACS